ncbi:hypothetical protein QQ045_024575 [Rhodiola kirilowii]
MEWWRELLDVFLNSPTPESVASLWLQSSANASSSQSTVVTTISFLSLLMNPVETLVIDSVASTPKRSVMWIRTLPNMVQSRILSFLVMDHRRFCARDLSWLAKSMLSGGDEVDFWVKRAARNLLDVLSDLNCDMGSEMSLESDGQRADDEFEAIPVWLKHAASSCGSLLPWLPFSRTELNSDPLSHPACDSDSLSMGDVGAHDEVENAMELDTEVDARNHHSSFPLKPEVLGMAEMLKGQILCFESTSRTVGLATEIRNLCMDKEHDPLLVLCAIEPWRADDQTAAILISQLTKTDDEELGWPSQVLCSTVLPKLLVLDEPASRVLIAATVEYCKLNQRAAAYALLFPIFFRKEGINRHLSDVITKIITECLHPAHASAFFQRLLTAEDSEKGFLALPCHQCLLSKNLVWTESVFTIFQNVLDHNIHLTQDSVDHLVHQVLDLAETYPKSLKFGTFLLCLLTKCQSMLIPHKRILSEAVGRTNTLVTKSVMAKLASI